MINVSEGILGALIALLIDKFVLVRSIGHSAIQVRNSDYVSACLIGFAVLIVTTAGTFATGLITGAFPSLSGTPTILLVLIFSLLIISIPIELLVSYTMAFDHANRFVARAIIISSILTGIAVLEHFETGRLPSTSLSSLTLNGVISGSIFLVFSIIAVGLRERIRYYTRKQPNYALTIEILTLSIITIIFSWCKGF